MQVQLREEKIVSQKAYSELVFEQLRDLKQDLRDLKQEIRDNKRDTDDKLNSLNQRIDRLEDKISGSTRHAQILTGSAASIALAVIYSILK